MKCGVFHSTDRSYPQDPHGCLLPVGHDGPHEFASSDGKRYQWKTDLECVCEHCQEADGDYCTTYWEVQSA